MDKAYKDIDGVIHVAVLYSPGYGAGWSTWNNVKYKQYLLFEPIVVSLIEEGKLNQVKRYIEDKYGEDVYTSGVEDLTIRWLPEGTLFTIREHDGNETLNTINEIEFEVT